MGSLKPLQCFSEKKKKAGKERRQKLLFPESKQEAGLYTELLKHCRVVENESKSQVLLEDQQEYVEYYYNSLMFFL